MFLLAQIAVTVRARAGEPPKFRLKAVMYWA